MTGHATATLGGGCFWCLEAAYQRVAGVTRVESGYAGGSEPDPSYRQVASGQTGHAEVVRVEFDPGVIGYGDLLDVFWLIHDPTTPNRQGNDVGPQYRSIILYYDEEQRAQAEQSKQAIAASWPDRVVTEIKPLQRFYPAEAEHRDYYRTHPEQAYCQVVINPKLQKLREQFRDRLVSEDPS